MDQERKDVQIVKEKGKSDYAWTFSEIMICAIDVPGEQKKQISLPVRDRA